MIDWPTVFYISVAAILGTLTSLALSILVGKRLKKQREAWEREDQERVDEFNKSNGGT